MRAIHFPHIREKAAHLIHEPLFWAILVLAALIILMLFFVTINPESQYPIYPYYGFYYSF
jgi:hypothetical protein